MGYGLPGAIGAKIGNPDVPVISISGDGGMQMTIQELGTIMQEKLDVKIIILNNNFLGMVRQWQELFFHERYSNTIMEIPDFVAIAKAYGIASRAVEKREELDEVCVGRQCGNVWYGISDGSCRRKRDKYDIRR